MNINFEISSERCIKCGQCVKDCPMRIIQMEEDIPYIKDVNEKKCIKCQHCLAVCPTAAVSILGVNPDECISAGNIPDAESMDALIRNRRSVRRFKKADVPPEKMQMLYTAAANAPTGENDRKVTLHVIDSRADMDIFMEKAISRIEEIAASGELPRERRFFKAVARAYRMGNDIIFRGAPHLIVASSHESAHCPVADGIISLSYMELTAYTLGVGTVWVNFVMEVLELAPELKELLGIPSDHVPALALLAGLPDVKYPRGVARDDIDVRKVRLGGS